MAHGQPRRDWNLRCAMDDRGQRIIHQEMPKGDHAGRMHGFQLWGNLPTSLKMTDPRYQEVKADDIPDVQDDDGAEVRIVCGSFWGKTGAVEGFAADPICLDVSVPPGQRKPFRSKPHDMHSPMCSRALLRFARARESSHGRIQLEYDRVMSRP
jgi:hypothetical protein